MAFGEHLSPNHDAGVAGYNRFQQPLKGCLRVVVSRSKRIIGISENDTDSASSRRSVPCPIASKFVPAHSGHTLGFLDGDRSDGTTDNLVVYARWAYRRNVYIPASNHSLCTLIWAEYPRRFKKTRTCRPRSIVAESPDVMRQLIHLLVCLDAHQ